MRLYIYIICVVTVLLTVSCGRQHDAEKTVEEFVAANHTTPDDVDFIKFYDIDSTRILTDSVIVATRERASARFRKDISYSKFNGGRLVYLRAEYKCGTDTLSATFYLQPTLEGVVAFKENG